MGRGRTETLGQGQSFDCVTIHPVVTVSLGAGVQQLFSVETQKVTGVSLAFLGGKGHRPRELFSCRVIEDHAGRAEACSGLDGGSWGSLLRAGVELRPGVLLSQPGVSRPRQGLDAVPSSLL